MEPCPICGSASDPDRIVLREMLFGTRERFPYLRVSVLRGSPDRDHSGRPRNVLPTRLFRRVQCRIQTASDRAGWPGRSVPHGGEALWIRPPTRTGAPKVGPKSSSRTNSRGRSCAARRAPFLRRSHPRRWERPNPIQPIASSSTWDSDISPASIRSWRADRAIPESP